jgi:hypothetical protein
MGSIHHSFLVHSHPSSMVQAQNLSSCDYVPKKLLMSILCKEINYKDL